MLAGICQHECTRFMRKNLPTPEQIKSGIPAQYPASQGMLQEDNS
jgi:hypothetical protein